MIFAHQSLSDSGYWADQVNEFAKHDPAVEYSRRYNGPNRNPARAGYSAVVDAEDLAGFIAALHFGPVVGEMSRITGLLQQEFRTKERFAWFRVQKKL